MAFTDIDATHPLGTEKGKMLDDYIRELKEDVETNLAEISGYPDLVAPYIPTWTTAGRPTSGLKDGISGYNSTTNVIERYDGSAWDSINQTAISSWTYANRPASPYTGQFGYVSDLAVIERWTGTAWERIAGGCKGDIKMWSGSASAIETGWCLADGVARTHPDGSSYTPPDLRDKFIVGAGSTYAVAATGGEATHILTEAEMPSHVHTFTPPLSVISWGSDGHGKYTSGGGDTQDSTIGSADTASAGSGTAHNNLPPYYALCFLYKL